METNNKNIGASPTVGGAPERSDKVPLGYTASPLLCILLRDVFVIYLISFIAILALTIIFSYINGEVVIDNFMLNFRSYLLGSIHTGEEILSARFESIGVFAIHFTLFFTYFFLHLFSNRRGEGLPSPRRGEPSRRGELREPTFYFIVGLVLTIFLRETFLFCLPGALTLAALITLCKNTICRNVNIEDKYIIVFNRVLLTLTSIYGIVSFIIRYI